MNEQAGLNGYEVLLGVTGGIAVYKAAALTSRLVQAGAGVSVAMTAAARQFVTPLTFQSLSGRAVHTSLWEATGRYDPQHIALTDRADLVILAPATANIIGKIATGIADELVSTLTMAATSACSVLLAPAMNSRMWASPVVAENVEKLRGLGMTIVGPGTGYLACGTVGPGRLAEPEEIFQTAESILRSKPPKVAS